MIVVQDEPTSIKGRRSKVRATVTLCLSLFCVFGVKIWNRIPAILQNRPKDALKIPLKGNLFDILQTEDFDIDVDTIINEMKN